MFKRTQMELGLAKAMIIGLGIVLVMTAACNQKGEESKGKSAPPVAPAAKMDLGQQAVIPATPAAPAPRKDPTKVVATVDGVNLTQGAVDAQLDRWLASVENRIPPERLADITAQVRTQIADQFVVKTLLANAAAKVAMSVSEQEIDQAIAEIKQRLPEGMTLEGVMKAENISLPDLRTNLVTELRIKKLIEVNVGTNLVPTEAEIEAFYASQKSSFEAPETVHARHILIKTASTDDAKAKSEKKNKADELQKKLVAGADFAALARENSDCPSKERGGDLGNFPRGQMVPSFEEAAFSQTTNAIGPVIETMFGYHIIQVLEHQQAKTQTLAEARDRIVPYLQRQKEREAFQAYLETLKATAKITIDPDMLPPPQPRMPMNAASGVEPARPQTPPAPPAPNP